MDPQKPCELCGSTQVNLHDGFYFCAECGTQDKNFQETLVEIIETDGELILGNKTKVHKIKEKEKEMPEGWYKWHGFNFLLKGTADELVQHGASPSFKTKLLWVWTRYLKYYLKNKEIGLDEEDRAPTPEPEEIAEDSDEDLPQEEMYKYFDKLRDKFLKKYSFTLLVTLNYIALNLDQSAITLTHLIKLFKDGILSVPYRIHNIIPPEIKPDKLRRTIKRGLVNFKVNRIRILAMTLFKRLDLGNPVIPDIRLLIDNYLKELCLPNDLKPLVLSLMHYKVTNLDVNTKDVLVYKMPYYELQVMTYIIWALKLCLGLDGFYEVKLSGAVEAINKSQGRLKSHFVYGESASTDRQFSFREWVTFYQFRQIMLRYYVHRLANKTSWDTDDHIALEHHMDAIDSEYDKKLRDEMTHDLINSIHGGEVDSDLIPRSEFIHSITPFHDYTQIIVQHLTDREVKMKLSEDFSRYSLKYAIVDWNLVHPQSETNRNLVKGIKMSNKLVSDESLNRKRAKLDHRMVYVRDCDNHNWFKTKAPTADHVIDGDDLDSDDEVLSKYVTKCGKTLENKVVSSNCDKLDADLVENGIETCTNNNDIVQTDLIGEISGPSYFSSRIQFEDDKDVNETKLDEAEKNMLKELSDSIANDSEFPDLVSEHSFANNTLSNTVVCLDETKIIDSKKFDDNEMIKMTKNYQIYEIKEEAEGINIFDDDFKEELKEETVPCEFKYESEYENFDNVNDVHDSFQDVPRNTSENNKDNDSASQCSSLDSVNFNEKTFDRGKAIREIILHMCKKHKLPVPAEYNPRQRTVNGARKEMGAFAVGADHTTHRTPNKKKRDFAEEKLRRGLLKDVITDYHNAAREDILNKLTISVNAAIETAIRHNESNLGITQEVQPTNDALETDTMEIDANSHHSDNINDPVEENTEGTNSQQDNQSVLEESRLFSDDSDGETHAKELLPEINPNYDEKLYNSEQLYLKTVEIDDDVEMDLDPELSRIIDKKIAKDDEDPSLLTWTEERKLERPDSEDEMPLSVLQDLQSLQKKLSEQHKTELSPFLSHKVENFRYWFKILPLHDLGAYGRKFDKQLSNDLPKSFAFVLKECAFILGVKEGELYRNLQAFELSTLERLSIEKPDFLKKRGPKVHNRSY